jgi:hypothetical protein
MGISRSALLTEISNDLLDSFGEVETASGQRCDRALDRAVNDLWKAYQWSWLIGSYTINTVQGTTLYDPPTDFDNLVIPERVDFYGRNALYGVQNPIQDQADGERVIAVYDRGKGKIEFSDDPGNGTQTLWYRKTCPLASASLESIPDAIWTKNYLAKRTAYYYCSLTPDWAKEAQMFFQESERIKDQEKLNMRNGQSRQRLRTPKGVNQSNTVTLTLR